MVKPYLQTSFKLMVVLVTLIMPLASLLTALVPLCVLNTPTDYVIIIVTHFRLLCVVKFPL